MPLPLPNLDTRRWIDLVDEARALIPRYAPDWTDHNIHDPGMTLVELFAWLTELAIYRINRIPLRHRRKFLALVGFAPAPPQPARTALAFTPIAAETVVLPAGLTLAAVSGTAAPLPFRTTADLHALPVQILAVQSFDGANFTDLTRSWQEKLPFLPWGASPAADRQPALYLGFEQALPENQPLSLWFRFQGDRVGWQERDRILAEAREQSIACQPPMRICAPLVPPADPWCATAETAPSPDSPSSDSSPDGLPPHHSVGAVWEYFNGTDWQVLDADTAAVDDTRSLTLDGTVRLTLPAAIGASVQGVVDAPAFYLRCRLLSGVPDRPPVLAGITLNAVAAEQIRADRSTLTIAPGVVPAAGSAPLPGQIGRLSLSFNASGVIAALAFDSTADAPEVFVIDYQPATAAAPGTLTTTLTQVGQGTGLPHQSVQLAGTVALGQVQVWTIASSSIERWHLRPDLDASRRTDAHIHLDDQAVLSFGDGEVGRVVPADAQILAVYDQTAGAAGNLAAPVQWQLSGADDVWNRAILNPAIAEIVETTAARLQAITACAPVTGGADAEAIDHAAGRAVEALWAHERLVELCDQTRCTTLDQLDKAAVLDRTAPRRATTLLDFERLALTVPGTQVVRARAWAGIDPDYPCLQAPGTVIVVIVPELPLGRPTPTAGLLQAVQQSLDRRRVIGTRLRVVAPQYLEVRVEAVVQSKAVSSVDRVQTDILQALNQFLDPLRGGTGYGWAFGRDVYRSEILQVIDEVAGVDHVLSLRLIPGTGEAQCGNLCVAPTWLVTPGQHSIEVV
jgi:predicted phage baseplate assembly protein